MDLRTVQMEMVRAFVIGCARLFVSTSSPFGYQWRLDGSNLAGATNASLTLTNVQPNDAGNYSVRITNSAGVAISSNAVLKLDVVFATSSGLNPVTEVWRNLGNWNFTNLNVSLPPVSGGSVAIAGMTDSTARHALLRLDDIIS